MSLTDKIPYDIHVAALFLCAFCSFLLTILVTFSAPFIRQIAFLTVEAGIGRVHLGAFGWCAANRCFPSQAAYSFSDGVNSSLTGAMILWPIAVAFIFFVLVATTPLLLAPAGWWIGPGNKAFFTFSLGGAFMMTTVAWILTIFGWSVAHHDFAARHIDSSLGSAVWLGLTAFMLMTIAFLLDWPVGANAPPQPIGSRFFRKSTATEAAVPAGTYYHYKRTTREVETVS